MFNGYEGYEGYEGDDYSTDNESLLQITPEEVRSFRTQLEEKLRNKPKSELTALATRLGLLALTVATGLTSLLIIHNSARQSRLADITIAQEQTITKTQLLAQTEQEVRSTKIDYYNQLTTWNKETPANPDKVGTIQAAVLNGAAQIRQRIIEQIRDRENPNYGKPYLEVLISVLQSNDRTLILPHLAGKVQKASINITYADGTTGIFEISGEEAAALAFLRKLMFIQTLEEVNYDIDLAYQTNLIELIEEPLIEDLIDEAGLKGTLNPEEVKWNLGITRDPDTFKR